MSVSLVTKGKIGGRGGGGGADVYYPVPIEEVEVEADGIEGPYMDVETDDFPSTPSPDGVGVVPNAVLAESIQSLKPRLNVFPPPY
jgi:hypothetical protein